MPELIRLYIRSVFVGFGVSAVFTAALVWWDVAGIGHLILGSDIGWIAAAMMVFFNGIVFAAVQFAVKIMAMEGHYESHPDGAPLILFGYYNPLLQYGLEKLARDAAAAGADGFLVVDLPPEEAVEIKMHTDSTGLDLIFLLAPTSGPERINSIVKHASGFIYYVSLTGVTGVRSTLDRTIRNQLETIRKKSPLPIGVGFGISTPEHAKTVARWADAVVVGSALIKIISGSTSKAEAVHNAGRFIRTLKMAME